MFVVSAVASPTSSLAFSIPLSAAASTAFLTFSCRAIDEPMSLQPVLFWQLSSVHRCVWFTGLLLVRRLASHHPCLIGCAPSHGVVVSEVGFVGFAGIPLLDQHNLHVVHLHCFQFFPLHSGQRMSNSLSNLLFLHECDLHDSPWHCNDVRSSTAPLHLSSDSIKIDQTLSKTCEHMSEKMRAGSRASPLSSSSSSPPMSHSVTERKCVQIKKTASKSV